MTVSVNKTLVIVESPAKAKTIENYLGKDYIVRASYGHLRDLPKSKMGVDVDNNFEPMYTSMPGKSLLIKELKTLADDSQAVILATDPDREGEAISWHILKILGLNDSDQCRITFNEITKKAICDAISRPRVLDMNLVNAQQTRRILDRLVGYKLSPLLWEKVKKGLSAGRVQSAVVKIIVDREKMIRDFIPEEYWTIDVILQTEDSCTELSAKFYGIENEKVKLCNETETNNVLKDIKSEKFIIDKTQISNKNRKAYPPFITSTLQQDAMRKLNFTSKRTMMVAQELYEGVSVNGNNVGLITYMRTDSKRISEEAQVIARDFIKANYGTEYIPDKPNIYSTSKNAQDAHEAIRPSHIDLKPDEIKSSLTQDQYKLYKLIFNRFIASQMAPAKIKSVSYVISCGKYTFRASGSQIVFDGNLIVYDSQSSDEKECMLPVIDEGSVLDCKSIDSKQNFTQPVSRYNEASLIKYLEENGIGRPSTYAPIISTIQDRGYVEKNNRSLVPTELGETVTELLTENFEKIVDVGFTAEMENHLDSIENDGADWRKILKDFYVPFEEELIIAKTRIKKVEMPARVSDVVCEKCGELMVYKKGRYGEFLACPNFPKCNNTKPIIKKIAVKCPKCGGDIIERKSSKRRRVFYGCSNYPKCDYVSWNMPLEEKCDECGSYMVKTGTKSKKCSNPDCPTNKK